MPIIPHEYPILEYDHAAHAVINPKRDGPVLPPVCILTFFGEVMPPYILECEGEIVHTYRSEMRDFPVFTFRHGGVTLGLVQAVVGAGSIAMMADFLIGHGAKTLLSCGSCGVLRNIAEGSVILPTCALRDEGASYHYLPPAREIALDEDVLMVVKQTLLDLGVPFIECKTWTTDGFYRETPDMVAHRKKEGCAVVEMECATIAAVARFRGARFGQLLYSGDTLHDPLNYDDRLWKDNHSAREALFSLAVSAAIRLSALGERQG